MSFIKKLLSSSFLALALLLGSFIAPTIAQADNSNNYNNPHFANCPNPGGTVIASYSDGWHWIVGNSNLQWGSDVVYSQGNNNFVQCFCPKDQAGNVTGEGTQTNWIYASNLNSGQQNALQAQGWTLISDGTPFGLPAGAYLVKNSSYNCNASCDNKNITQSSHTYIKNDVDTHLNTGGNTSNNNTGGSSQIFTDNTQASVHIDNMANINKIMDDHQNLSQNLKVSILGNGANSQTTIHLGL